MSEEYAFWVTLRPQILSTYYKRFTLLNLPLKIITVCSCPAARQALSFNDLVEKPKKVETFDDHLSQQLKMLLKVQA